MGCAVCDVFAVCAVCAVWSCVSCVCEQKHSAAYMTLKHTACTPIPEQGKGGLEGGADVQLQELELLLLCCGGENKKQHQVCCDVL